MEVLYLTLCCHHHNDSCIKMGSKENHFNVSLKGWGWGEGEGAGVTRRCPQTTSSERKEIRSGESNPRRPLTSLRPYC